MPGKHFSRVLMQQGRVQLDADWNEQASIILHQLRSLACDLGSEHWGPAEGAGFEIQLSGENDLSIGAGHYYVKGILCEVEAKDDTQPLLYSNQPDYPIPEDQQLEDLIEELSPQQPLLVYLDVWERHIVPINDDSIREIALGGPDTATRAQVVWQVKAKPLAIADQTRDGVLNYKQDYPVFLEEIADEIKPGTGRLTAKVKDKSGDDKNPCLVAPSSRYRGAENQLYRVEVHQPGAAGNATFKWSRENASVIFPIESIQGATITLEHLGRDCRFGLKANDWVEIVDDDSVLQNRAETLLKIESVDAENRQVTVKSPPGSNVGNSPEKHPFLRRWDQKAGNQDGIVIVEGVGVDGKWFELEGGILIQFEAAGIGGNVVPQYRTGDYWLIPARTATGDVEWPKNAAGEPLAADPHGVVHHYAPLALLTITTAAGLSVPSDLRRILQQLWT